jgi:acylphosphatase
VIARRAVVSGRVQGVGFRWHTRLRAVELGVVGWVRNTASGMVEAHMEGDETAVDSLAEWLATGPAAAQVTSLDVVSVSPIGAESFDITT